MLGEISSDVKGILVQLDSQIKWMKDHENRIGTIENKMAEQKGMVKAWAVFSGVVSSLAIAFFQYWLGKR